MPVTSKRSLDRPLGSNDFRRGATSATGTKGACV
jgi:hypothetical protein